MNPRLLVVGCTFFLASCASGVLIAPISPTPSPPPLFGAPARSATFNYTGAQQNFVVPAGVTQLQITISGAQGGDAFNPVPGQYNWGVGGKGGSLTATVGVTPAESLAVFVGGKGGQGDMNGDGAGGYNGGASGAAFVIGRPGGGGGGGASDVRQGGTALTNRTVVASGGGGGGGPYQDGFTGNPCWCLGGGGTGGAGGLILGSDGSTGVEGNAGGGGGTDSFGGASRCGKNGVITNGAVGRGGGNGGVGCNGGAGGGGFYGGGNGTGSALGGGGGGGGSSFLAINARLKDPQPGPRSGDGQVIISW